MELCSHGHDEICFDGGRCPLCDTIELLRDAERELEQIELKYERLEDDYEKMQNSLAAIENAIRNYKRRDPDV